MKKDCNKKKEELIEFNISSSRQNVILYKYSETSFAEVWHDAEVNFFCIIWN